MTLSTNWLSLYFFLSVDFFDQKTFVTFDPIIAMYITKIYSPPWDFWYYKDKIVIM